MRLLRWSVALTLLLRLSLPAPAADPGVPAATGGDPWIRSLVVTRNFQLGRPVRPQFTPDGSTVLFLRAGARDPRQALFAFDVGSGRTREVLTAGALTGGTPEVLSAEEQARRERQRQTSGGLVSFEIAPDGRHLLVPHSGRLFWVGWNDGTVRAIPTGPGVTDPRLSPDGTRVAYVRDHDLWVVGVDGQRETRLTRGGSSTLTHGEAEFVAQEEMDRATGHWWSPDGSQLVFEEADHTGVEVWQVGDPLQPGNPPAPQFYPRPGKQNVAVRLGIVGVRGGRPRWIEWDRARYPYLARANWHAQGGLTLSVQTRDQRELAVLKVNPGTGRTALLFREEDPAWVNLDASIPRWFDGGRRFLWTSERSGHWELEVRGADGAPERTLVKATNGWQGFLSLDEPGNKVWFHASPDPTEQHLWHVPLSGGDAIRHSVEPGVHTGVVAARSRGWTLASATASTLSRTRVFRADGTAAGELPSVAEEPTRPVQLEILKVGEGEGWHARVVRPTGFQPGRRYPVIVSVYGGPHVQVVRRSLATAFTDQWLADQGFLVVAFDGRGTPGRGRAWERAVFGKLGPVPLQEQSSALRALAQVVPELDLERVGITGWSFGGYLSAFAVLKEPGLFRAAVAGAPVTDWEDYDTHYTERYMGIPTDPGTQAAYRASSCLVPAAELQRPLLLIHGTRDDNVYFRHSLRLADALLRAGRPFEILPLPGFTHMVPDPVIAEQRWRRTAEHFRRHL